MIFPENNKSHFFIFLILTICMTLSGSQDATGIIVKAKKNVKNFKSILFDFLEHNAPMIENDTISQKEKIKFVEILKFILDRIKQDLRKKQKNTVYWYSRQGR